MTPSSRSQLLALTLLVVLASLGAEAQTRSGRSTRGRNTRATTSAQATTQQSHQLNVIPVTPGPTSGSMRRARSGFAVARTFSAAELNHETLKSLIGTEISYSGRYNEYDHTDDRKIEGRGIVYRTEIWANDTRPSLSIAFLNNKGKVFNVQVEVTSPSFRLESRGVSPLAAIKARAEADGLTFLYAPYIADSLSWATKLRSLPAGKVRIAYVDHSSGQPEIKEIEAISMLIPSDSDIVLASAFGKPTPKFEFKTSDGVIAMPTQEIVAFAH